MTAIIDYGVGNLFSLKSSFEVIGETVVVSGDSEVLKLADRIVLPGVGAFRDAIRKLRDTGLDRTIKHLAADGVPLLGICLGMQLLFEESFEFGQRRGLGLLKGSVKAISPLIPQGYKVPHIGWNALRFSQRGKASPLFRYIKEGEHVYFVHSYAAMDCGESLLADTEYGVYLTAAVAGGKVFGTQFHPEKSGETGLNILRAFCEEVS
jgi:glutamine amidotransferase